MENLCTMNLTNPKNPRNSINTTNTLGGYTLIELIVVVVLIGLFLGLSAPRFQSALVTDDLKTTTRRIMGLLNSLRDEAIREHKVYMVHLDLESNRLWIEFEGMGEEERAVARERALKFPSGVRILDVWRSGTEKKVDGETVIHFSKKGYVEQSVIHVGAYDGRQFSLVLRPFLGTIKIYDKYVDIGTM
jgi:prepilin-type N-terminal cleavage/methylation domain-containing protein